MGNIAQSVILLWGWRRVLAAILAGALSALAMPPVDFFPILFLTFPVLVWLIDASPGLGGTSHKRGTQFLLAIWSAFSIGWCFGFGFFLAGLNWIGSAFLVESDVFGWYLPIAVMAMPAGLALFTGFGCAVAILFWSASPYRIFALAAGLGLSEVLRSVLFTGFSWNVFGYAFTGYTELMQLVSIFGMSGLTIISIIVFSLPAAGPTNVSFFNSVTLKSIFISLAIIGCMFALGHWRLSINDTVFQEDFHVRVVQPNIKQSEKWKPENRDLNLQKLIDLSDIAISPQNAGLSNVDIVVWPETAVPFLIEEDEERRERIADLLPEQTNLFTGAVRRQVSADGKRQTIFNSIYMLNNEAQTLAIYDKTRLVPFGEYLPFRGLLSAIGFEQLARSHGAFSPGVGRFTVELAEIPKFSPLICYEVIFQGSVANKDNRPQWLLNVTNDAWFGRSAGPYQHLRQAVVRAIEEGLPLIRSANTGISAVIDPYGRLISYLDLNTEGVLDTRLPLELESTVFVKWGSLLTPIFIVAAFLMSFMGRVYSLRNIAL